MSRFVHLERAQLGHPRGNLDREQRELLKSSPLFTWYHTLDWRLELLSAAEHWSRLNPYVIHCFGGETVCGGTTLYLIEKYGEGCGECGALPPPEVLLQFLLLQG